ncbi:MAG: S8 family peptidase [Gammaproteobacteria bacterium]
MDKSWDRFMDKPGISGAAAIIAALSFALPLHQVTAAPLAGESFESGVGRLIVKFRTSPGKTMSTASATRRITAMAAQTGVDMNMQREMSGGAHLISMGRPMAPRELAALARNWSHLPDIEYADPDRRYYPARVPNDPSFAGQYYLRNAAAERAAINAPAAWDTTTGSTGVTVAVIDSGIRPEHIDIAGRLAPGYDFISNDPDGSFFTANDGDGRDANPSDPGDGVTAGACGADNPPVDQPSVWHGTRVASLIGAVTNNGQGIAGVDWNARILPVRAIGRCVGFGSDIIDAARWAAGLPVPGVPRNVNPARIINLSLGGGGTCIAAEQDAIDDIIAAGAVVVAAAGNDATNALRTAPSSCQGVLPVAGSTRDGALVSSSNFGAKVGLTAPGVDILTAANRGTQAPVLNGDTYSTISGTSFSSPLVAGVASLMLSLNDSLTPRQLIATLRASARPFPAPVAGRRCSDPLCGAGLLDAGAAVRAVATGNIAPPGDGGNGLRAAFAKAAPLPLGTTSNGALTVPYAFDVYRLSLPAGSRLRVATTGRTDTYGYLFDANGRLLAQLDDIVPSTNLNFALSASLGAGTYFVAVEGVSTSTNGPYALKASLSTRNGGGGAADLMLCGMLLGGLGGLLFQRRPGQRANMVSTHSATMPPRAP